MRAYFLFILALCAISHSGFSQPKQASLNEADQLKFQFKTEQAYALYEKVWQSPGHSLLDRVTAGRALARMDWHVYNKASKATKRLKEICLVDAEQGATYRTWTRMLVEQGKSEEAMEKAKQALAASKSETDVYNSKVWLLRALLQKYKQQAMSAHFAAENPSPELQQGYAMISHMIQEGPGDVTLSDLYLGMSLLLQKGEDAHRAWLSYYRVTNEIPATLQDPEQALKKGCTTLHHANAPLDDRLSLIKGLAESGFMEYAVMMTKYAPQRKKLYADPYIKDLLHYYAFLQQLKKINQQFYRATAIGKENKGKFNSALHSAKKTLWNKWSRGTEKMPFSENNFQAELERRFHAVYKVMTANNYYGMHYGHLVLDEKREVTQYGSSGELRYMQLDHMVSNGYSSWFWDGSAEVGGWAPDGSVILQVRSAYASSPVKAWLMVTDSVQLSKIKADILKFEQQDDSVALKEEVAYLPGLARKLELKVKFAILDSLKSTGLQGADLRLAFINTFERQEQESSIFAHEGRHAIDLKSHQHPEGEEHQHPEGEEHQHLGSEELEYRAKLSEIRFATQPFLGLIAILSRNIKDGTPHGQANYRVLQGIVAWMKAHQAQIKAFDASRPVLPQIHKLSPTQLAQAVESFDPLAQPQMNVTPSVCH